MIVVSESHLLHSKVKKVSQMVEKEIWKPARASQMVELRSVNLLLAASEMLWKTEV